MKYAHKKTPLRIAPKRGSCKKSGETYFRYCVTIIGSAGLTTVFEMGTGVALQIWSPEESSRPSVSSAETRDSSRLRLWIDWMRSRCDFPSLFPRQYCYLSVTLLP